MMIDEEWYRMWEDALMSFDLEGLKKLRLLVNTEIRRREWKKR